MSFPAMALVPSGLPEVNAERARNAALFHAKDCHRAAKVFGLYCQQRVKDPAVHLTSGRGQATSQENKFCEESAMSVVTPTKRVTVPEIRAHKNQKPIVCLTCYHAHTAKLLDEQVDLMLVGDSLGMVMHGMETTLGVTLEMMIAHGKAVMRGSKHALVVVDMPFGSYEESPQIAFRGAGGGGRGAGAAAGKMEGGARLAETIKYLVQRGIPVMGHIGLTPQATNIMGGFKTQGRTEAEWPAIEADAAAVAEAGAFAVVLVGLV